MTAFDFGLGPEIWVTYGSKLAGKMVWYPHTNAVYYGSYASESMVSPAAFALAQNSAVASKSEM